MDFTADIQSLLQADPAEFLEEDDGPDYDEDLPPQRCAPVPYVLKEPKKLIGIVDCETDPFEEGVIPAPFAIGLDLPDRYLDFWGDDCVDQLFAYLATLTAEGIELILYAHNGGKFDFFFFLKYLDEQKSPLIMGGRLVKIYFQGIEFRDSYAIIPEPLAAYKKDEIDYNKFRRENRQKNKREILKYLRSDCKYLRHLVEGFITMFGDCITVAAASLRRLNSYHGFERLMGTAQDDNFRKYYYGGRNQCFETGILTPRHGDKFYIYDRRSMYPAEMRDTLHPISNQAKLTTKITKNTDFACIEAINDGALPMRADDGSLSFTCKRGVFWATIHEINAGLETGTLKILRVRHAWEFDMKSTFAEFVNDTFRLRMDAIEAGLRIEELNLKRCMNSSYGKFALNPRKFRQWQMTIDEIPEPQASKDNPNGWTLHSQSGTLFIWSRPSPRKGGFYNVATAASITGAARANLLRNLSHAKRPLYCDTDSIICEGLQSPDGMGDDLGQWKIEATGNRLAIAGKKLYAFYDDAELKAERKAKKLASKGVRLTAEEIISVCNGNEIVYRNPVPTFALDGGADFIERTIRMTG